jgi:diguanylate cyclase (GGDEF)-like protein
MSFRIATIFLFTVIFFRSGLLFSEEQAHESLDALTIVTIEDTLPFSFRLPDGTPSGLYVEFWELWSETNNIPIRFVLLPYEEGIKLIRNKNTLHSGLFRNDKREKWADFSLPIHNVQTGFIYNRSINKNTKFSDLKDIKVSTHHMSFQEFYIRENYPDIELSTYQNFDEGVNQLLNNDVQAIFAEIPSVNARLAKKGLSGVFVISEEVIVSNNVFALIAKGQPDLLAKINDGIENIPVNKIIDLEKKWLPTLKPFFSNDISIASLTLAERKWLQELPSLSLGIELDWHPYEYVNEKGEYSGLSADYIDYIENSLSLKIEVDKNYSWLESLTAIENNKIDLISAISRTTEREKVMLFTEPYFSAATVLVSRKNGFNADSLSSLKGRSIGIPIENALSTYIAADYPEIKIIIVDSTVIGLKKLNEGEFDAFINDISIINHVINKEQLSNLIITGFSPYRLNITMAVRTELEPLVGILNKIFLNMTEKEKAAIANNWLSVQVNTGTELSTIIFWVLPIVLLLILIILIFVRLNRRFKELSLTDQLTGLRNRRFLQNNIKNDVDIILRMNLKAQSNQLRERQIDSDLIFFMLDFDHFKQINDIHGHTTGDAVLSQIKSILNKVFRKTDYLVRWGGEEFLVISRFINRKHAPELAERLRQSVETYDFDIGKGETLNKTCSIGFSCFPFLVNKPEYLSWEQVLDIADHCMFAAKKSSRNAWVGLNNINYSEGNETSNITGMTKELIDMKQLEVETSITDKTLLKWN